MILEEATLRALDAAGFTVIRKHDLRALRALRQEMRMFRGKADALRATIDEIHDVATDGIKPHGAARREVARIARAAISTYPRRAEVLRDEDDD